MGILNVPINLMPKIKETKMAKKKIWSVMLTAFVIAVTGCGSSPSFDPQQLVGSWLFDGENSVMEITIRPDDTVSLTTYTTTTSQPETFDLRLTNDGKSMTDGEDTRSVRLESGKLVIADRLTFSRAQPAEVADSVWIQKNNAFEIKYTFANDGTYKIEYGGLATMMDGSILNLVLGELSNAGIDGTGTYTVSDHYVTLKPNGGTYIVGTPPGNFAKREADSYTLVFISGQEFFVDGYYYKKQ